MEEIKQIEHAGNGALFNKVNELIETINEQSKQIAELQEAYYSNAHPHKSPNPACAKNAHTESDTENTESPKIEFKVTNHLKGNLHQGELIHEYLVETNYMGLKQAQALKEYLETVIKWDLIMHNGCINADMIREAGEELHKARTAFLETWNDSQP